MKLCQILALESKYWHNGGPLKNGFRRPTFIGKSYTKLHFFVDKTNGNDTAHLLDAKPKVGGLKS